MPRRIAEPASRPNVNPFYIEPEGHDVWDDDWAEPDEYEMENLMHHHPAGYRPDPPVSPTAAGGRASRRAARIKAAASGWCSRRRLCTCIMLVIMVAVVLSVTLGGGGGDRSSSSTTESSKPNNSNDNRNDPAKATAPKPTAQPTKHPTPPSAPKSTPSPSKAPVPKSTLAPTAAPQKAPIVTTLAPIKTPTVGPTITRTTPGTTTTTTTSPSPASVTDGADGDDTEIVLFGERNSGVYFFKQLLEKCYPNQTIATKLTRETTWFQDPPPATLNLANAPRRVFVLVVRNLYDWAETMHRHPIAMSAHRTNGHQMNYLDKFLQRPWTAGDDPTPPSDGTICQLGFTPKQVTPCEQNEQNPATYELDKDGNVFSGILAMRDAKIRHVTSELPNMWPNVVDSTTLIIRYEEGPDFGVLHQYTGWEHACPDGVEMVKDDAKQSLLSSYHVDYLAWIKENVDWDTETSVGYQPVEPSTSNGNNNDGNEDEPATPTKDPVDEIVLFGERYSGVPFYNDLLKACYPDRVISTKLTRDTMWFQDHPPASLNQANAPRRVFILAVRNVYDWAEVMRAHPYGMSAHHGPSGGGMNYMDKFLKKPWTTGAGIDATPLSDDTICQLGFTPKQVIPCEENQQNSAIYELDSDGNVFSGILAMRAAKIHHVTQDLPMWWPNIVNNSTIVIRYEDGPNLSLIDEYTGWTHSCPENITLVMSDAATKMREYNQNDLDLLESLVDWDEEQWVGYVQRST